MKQKCYYINDRLKQLREDSGLTQQKFAKSLGLSQNAINLFENRKRVPSTETIIKIANIMNLSIDELCKEHREETDHQKYSSKQKKVIRKILSLNERELDRILHILTYDEKI